MSAREIACCTKCAAEIGERARGCKYGYEVVRCERCGALTSGRYVDGGEVTSRPNVPAGHVGAGMRCLASLGAGSGKVCLRTLPCPDHEKGKAA